MKRELFFNNGRLKLRYNFVSVLLKTQLPQEDNRRKAFILNVLLLGSIALCLVAFLLILISYFRYRPAYEGAPIWLPLLVLILFSVLYFLARLNFYLLSAYSLIIILCLLAAYSSLTWGTAVPGILLLYAVMIVMAGLMIGVLFSFILTIVISIFLITLAYLEANGITHPDLYWTEHTTTVADGVGFAFMLLIIALVSWLSNREITRSLSRARRSEAALKKERDQLEINVEERTRELKQAQLEKLLQLYRFAEFGKHSSGLLHDIVNPLNAVSLNLEKLSQKERSRLLKQALDGIKHIESFVQAARRQLQNQDHMTLFSVRSELRHVVKVLEHRAKERGVNVRLRIPANATLYGSTIKFHQLATNLIANAIDAYGPRDSKPVDRTVSVQAVAKSDRLVLSVRDQGKGIPAKNLNRIFEPFFTTKGSEKGTGIGLVIARNVAEKDFFGTINASSSKAGGTLFEVSLPSKRAR